MIDTLPKLLRERARAAPGEVALREKDYGIWQRVTWADYLGHVRRFCLGLVTLGLGRDDKIAILSENCREWIYAELDNQVYPDGVQIELASGYHHVSLSNFLAVYKIARLNDTPLPADFLKRLEKMYDFDVYGAMPDRRLPGVQDGNYYDVRPALAEAAGISYIELINMILEAAIVRHGLSAGKFVSIA